MSSVAFVMKSSSVAALAVFSLERFKEHYKLVVTHFLSYLRQVG